MTPSERDAFGNWLSGFTDGEGCFGLHRHGVNPSTGKRRGYHGLFRIELRGDDSGVLSSIKEYLGCGNLGGSPANLGYSPRKVNPTCTYFVSDNKSLHDVVIPNFEKFPLRSKKARDFAIWSQAIKYLHLIVKRKSCGNKPKWTKLDVEIVESYDLAIRGIREFNSDLCSITQSIPKPVLSEFLPLFD